MRSIIVPMHVGQNIQQARVGKGLTREEPVFRVNKSHPLISHAQQTGKGSAYTLRDICGAPDVTVEGRIASRRPLPDAYLNPKKN